MNQSTANQNVLVPGKTCWRIETAGRLAVIVDAADYFTAVKAAMLKAERSIMLVGWDFDTRIKFEPGDPTLDGPNQLGKFLPWLSKRKPDLHIRMLKWDLGMLQALGRGMTPVFILNWITGKRLTMKLDGVHPTGAAHHQKIVVIDDAMAFCGGIDLTAARWDTSAHLDHNPLRVKPGGDRCGPWHDATTAVDGDLARAMGELTRARWLRATGEELSDAREDSDPWPDCLTPDMHNVEVAIARTMPELENREEVREIEALYLAAIASAKHTIYLESQYLAARRIAEALAERLHSADGPEIIVVLPCEIESWLEHEAMDGARARLLHMLWGADKHKRFGAFFPHTVGGENIYVHAKIMIIDDVLLRVGSSNLNNRSLGYDTECDLAVEASDDDKGLRERIADIRRQLVCEHLAIETDAFDTAMTQHDGSVLGVINALRGKGKSLGAFDPNKIAQDESPLAENALLDPETIAPDFTTQLHRGWKQITRHLQARKKR